MSADLLDDPLTKYTMVNTATVEFENFLALRAFLAGLKRQLPLVIPVETMFGMSTRAIVNDIQVHHIVDTDDDLEEIDIMQVQVDTSFDNFHSGGIDADTKNEDQEKPDRSWMFSDAVRVRMRNRFFADDIHYIVFSDIMDEARARRRNQVTALLMGGHAKNRQCAAKRFVKHELFERQLLCVIKTFV